jgi:uncharacterized membrane protein AbrB (regulator of aidB expression)
MARGLHLAPARQNLQAADWIGWLSSLVLLVTLGNQVRKQWLSGVSQGVSRWLFVGQLAASTGFSVYSALLENWVFLVTNLLMVLNALAGAWVTHRNRRRQPASNAPWSTQPGAAALPSQR